MLRKTYVVLMVTLFCSLVFGGAVHAHNLWLNPDNYFPAVGTTVEIGIGWGHKYPANRVDQQIRDGQLEAIQAVDPNGGTVDLTKISTGKYQLAIDKPGAWLITARIKPGFFTMTPEGRKWGNKKAVENAVKCTNFHIQAKTVLIAGGSAKNLGGAAGQSVEIIPITDPSGIKAGDELAVQVLFNGKPLADASLKATYAGFGPQGMDHHHQKPPAKPEGAPPKPPADGKKPPRHKSHYPVETTTDAQGKAVLQLKNSGYWMIMLSHRCPFADSATCDEYMYNMAFTFEVSK
ncbi:DUF4198 domain-containing protein [Desulfosarcina ovata]|uniref:DUF4198 domain-containing protein n=1 Tax=Desulfosarcina ovata subsp. ovata TaxID=2752305 RepID=A0A5K8AAA4_9BACT|nr:DUF4198 domain-containing protein [Desulfosarcina ovata]BBO89525.1 hypothetical protein DSCOOX_27050 [Desulfosarcina ovata subsp. ovata]